MSDMNSMVVYREESVLLIIYQCSLRVLLVEKQPMCAYVAVLKRGEGKSMPVYWHCDMSNELVLITCGPVKILNRGGLQGWYDLHRS